MRYVSTRGSAPVLSFEEALLTGLARDGGLYVPETIPTLGTDELREMATMSYEDVAFRVMKPFVGDTFSDDEFKALIAKAYAGFNHKVRAPLVQLEQGHFLLELFHGPTLAFKDFAMQLIGHMFQAVLSRKGERVTIVGATSGDTGSAAIEAFRGLDNVDVFILFPHGRVSEVQRRQMTTPVEGNVRALAVDGDFDDCQALVKDMFNDFEFRDRVRLAGVNSINWARVLAQVVYYFSAAASLGAPDRKVSFSVPTGNFGDVFAGYVAAQMGLPVERLIVATNKNDILARAIRDGDYSVGESHATITPSMDIQVSSNFERLLFEANGRDAAALAAQMVGFASSKTLPLESAQREAIAAMFSAERATPEETLAAMRWAHESCGEVIDPHTAVGLHAARALAAEEAVPVVTLATAHPAKFPDAVKQAIGIEAELPARVGDLFALEERFETLPADYEAVRDYISAKATR